VRELSGPWNVPRTYSIDASSTSSRCAAIFFAFSMMRSAAQYSATPPTARLRLPYVSMPSGTTDVSPCSTSTSSIS